MLLFASFYLRRKIPMWWTIGRGTLLCFQRRQNGLRRLFSRLFPNPLLSCLRLLPLYTRSLGIKPGIEVFLFDLDLESKSEKDLESRWWTGFHGGSQDPTSPTASILKKWLKASLWVIGQVRLFVWHQCLVCMTSKSMRKSSMGYKHDQRLPTNLC